jgi:hypothetical protein
VDALAQCNLYNQFYKENIMKYLIAAILGLGMATCYAGGETKKVCRAEQKNGKKVQVCKTIKVHKKLEGTVVPPVKK